MVLALCVSDDRDSFFNGEFALPDLPDRALQSVRHHDFVVHKHRLLNGTEEVAGRYLRSGFNRGNKSPFFSPAHRRNAYPAKDVGAFCGPFDALQRTLDAVKKLFDKSRGKFNAQGFPCAYDRLSRPEARSFFVYLHRSRIIFKFDNFTDKPRIPDPYDVEHAGSGHAFSNYKRTGDLCDESCYGIRSSHSHRLHFHHFTPKISMPTARSTFLLIELRPTPMDPLWLGTGIMHISVASLTSSTAC